MTHKDLMLLVDEYASAYKNNLVLHPSVEQARAALSDALKQVVQDADEVERLKKELGVQTYAADNYRRLLDEGDRAYSERLLDIEKLKADNADLRSDEALNEAEAEIAKLRGLVAGRSAEYLAAHITYDKGYEEGRLDAESLNIPVAEIGVSIFTWLGDRPPAGTTLYRIEQP